MLETEKGNRIPECASYPIIGVLPLLQNKSEKRKKKNVSIMYYFLCITYIHI